MTETERRNKNDERLLKVDTTIRKEVRAVLGTLEHYGFRPVIAKEVWRSPEEQEAMFRRGVSKLKWGYHNAVRDGKPASLAADIVDAELYWDAPQRFFLTVGYAAQAQGLGWGGYWGLTKALKDGLRQALKVVKAGEPTPRRLKFGWDVSHCETARVSVKEARAGKR